MDMISFEIVFLGLFNKIRTVLGMKHTSIELKKFHILVPARAKVTRTNFMFFFYIYKSVLDFLITSSCYADNFKPADVGLFPEMPHFQASVAGRTPVIRYLHLHECDKFSVGSLL